MLLFKKLGLIIKMSTSQDLKTTFKYNVTCIFLSLRTKLKKTLCPRTPCMMFQLIVIQNSFKILLKMVIESIIDIVFTSVPAKYQDFTFELVLNPLTRNS